MTALVGEKDAAAMNRRLKIAVLFDGAGLARLGLERAGHDCTGFELDPAKHHLSRMVGSGNCVLADVRDVDLSGFDAVWASPPCQEHSNQNHGRPKETPYSDGSLLEWALNLPHDILWVENVISGGTEALMRRYREKLLVRRWNAVQFLSSPIQKRRRWVAGRYRIPFTYRDYKADYPEFNICPAILASEYKQGGMASEYKKERRKATRWYGRPLSVREMAYHQGFEIPEGLLRSWWHPMPGYTPSQWRVNLSRAIGNAVPVYMAQAFGEVYSRPQVYALQQSLWAA